MDRLAGHADAAVSPYYKPGTDTAAIGILNVLGVDGAAMGFTIWREMLSPRPECPLKLSPSGRSE